MAAVLLPAPALSLSPDEARTVTLCAQGLVGTAARRGGVPALLRRLGGVQLDTISVLARSHELVAHARLGALRREQIERAYWHPRRASAFEYWSHAACVLPIEEWPYYEFRRRYFRARGLRWHQSHPDVCEQVLARLQAEGPLTATELGGARKGGPWWDWSDTKIAVEWLLDTGRVICTRRIGWRRVYDLPERVLPADLLGRALTNEECLVRLAAVAGRALGVLTAADLTEYQRIRYGGDGVRQDDRKLTAAGSAVAAGLVPVTVGGSKGSPPARGWADPAVVDEANALVAARARHRTTLLSPFDSLVWDRKRTLRMFGFEHSLEAYVPQPKRVHGYYTMPLLAGGKLVGRVDPARSGSTLIARQLSMDAAAAVDPMARALTEAASWVGCDNVKVQQVEPAGLEPRLRSALAARGA